MAQRKPNAVAHIDCRAVGPGGTTIAFYPNGDRIKYIWSNEWTPDYKSKERLMMVLMYRILPKRR